MFQTARFKNINFNGEHYWVISCPCFEWTLDSVRICLSLFKAVRSRSLACFSLKDYSWMTKLTTSKYKMGSLSMKVFYYILIYFYWMIASVFNRKSFYEQNVFSFFTVTEIKFETITFIVAHKFVVCLISLYDSKPWDCYKIKI